MKQCILICVLTGLTFLLPIQAQEQLPVLPASRAADLEVLTLLLHESPVTEAYFSTTGMYFVTGTLDNKLHIWSAGENQTRLRGKRLYMLENYTPSISLVGFDDRDRYLATVLDTPQIQIRQAASGEILATFSLHEFPISEIDFLPDNRLLSRDLSDTVYIWDIASGDLLAEHKNILETAFSASTYALLNYEGEVKLFSEEADWVLPADADGLIFSPDGSWVATWGKQVIIWDADTGEKLFELADLSVDQILWTPDSRFIITQTFDTAEIWSVAENPGEQTDVFNRPGNGIETLMIAPNGKIAVTVDRDHRPRLWRLRGNGEVAQIGSLPALVDRISISPDSATLVGFEVGFETQFWWADTGFKGGETRLIPDSAIFSPDWHLLASHSDKVVAWYGLPSQEWSFETGPIGHPKRRSYVYPIPSEDQPFIIGLDADRDFYGVARTYDSAWVKIVIEDATIGWVQTETIAVQAELTQLPLVRTGRLSAGDTDTGVLLAPESAGDASLPGCIAEQTVVILSQHHQNYQIDCGAVQGWIPIHQVELDH